MFVEVLVVQVGEHVLKDGAGGTYVQDDCVVVEGGGAAEGDFSDERGTVEALAGPNASRGGRLWATMKWRRTVRLNMN